MKPSEKISQRVQELAKQVLGNDYGYYPIPEAVYTQAIIDYLDELAEEKR